MLANSFAGQLLRRATAGRPAPQQRELETPAEAVEETERVLRLEVGMHCPGCVQHIGQSLNQIEGVRSAVAEHEHGMVEIVYLDSKVSEDEICEHLRELGYEVKGHREHGLIKHEQG